MTEISKFDQNRTLVHLEGRNLTFEGISNKMDNTDETISFIFKSNIDVGRDEVEMSKRTKQEKAADTLEEKCYSLVGKLQKFADEGNASGAKKAIEQFSRSNPDIKIESSHKLMQAFFRKT